MFERSSVERMPTIVGRNSELLLQLQLFGAPIVPQLMVLIAIDNTLNFNGIFFDFGID